MVIRRMIGALWVATALVACSGPSGTAVDDGTYGGATPMTGDAGGATSTGMDDGGFPTGSAYDDDFAGAGPDTARDNRVVYFEFDRSDVKSDYRGLLEDHGRYLAANPGLRVRLEGHADERGSREYNIGLGEQRAQAVRQVLLLQGVAALQLSTVSYGEERPAVLGSEEEAWSLNRRVELVYPQ